MRERKIPKPGGLGKVRKLGIPNVADRVVQAALKLVLEPIFEAAVLLLHRHMPHEHVVAGLAAALRAGALTADAVALEARKGC